MPLKNQIVKNKKKKGIIMYGMQPHSMPGHYVIWEAEDRPVLYDISSGRLKRKHDLNPTEFPRQKYINPKGHIK